MSEYYYFIAIPVEFKVLKNITRYLLFLENIGWAGNV
jgi:hypothetical protein